jgi:hypothetical protein
MAKPAKKKSYYKPKTKLNAKIDPALIEAVRNQVLEELKADTAKHDALASKARDEGDAVRAKFVEEMKASPEPWVDVLMWVETPTGVKYQLDWNDAFIKHLESNGIQGTDEDQTVQKWVALLLRSSADNMDSKLADESSEKLESNFE